MKEIKRKYFRIIILVLLTVAILCIFIVCYLAREDNEEKDVFILKGNVLEVNENGLLISPHLDEKQFIVIYPSSKQGIQVSVSDSSIDYYDFEVGQTVVVEYDGYVLDVSPSRINAFSLKGELNEK